MAKSGSWRQPQACTLTTPMGLPSAGHNRRGKDQTWVQVLARTSGAGGHFELEPSYLSSLESLLHCFLLSCRQGSRRSALKFY